MSELDLVSLGHRVPSAAPDAWRAYDAADPYPGYCEFDWLSARHPDLYHRFALSTDGLIAELHRLFDVNGLDIADIGAGTGRSSLGVAGLARRVFAIDRYESVVLFGSRLASDEGAHNVHYMIGDRSSLPLADGSVDVAMTAWAESDPGECYRILRSDGLMVHMGTPPDAIAGELTPVLGMGAAPVSWYAADWPPQDQEFDLSEWNSVPLAGPLRIHDFTYVADYGAAAECAAIVGRLFGPDARRYVEAREQATLSWRLRIYWCRVRKE